MTKNKLTFLILFILVTSCSIQKRYYMKGFYVSHKTKPETKSNRLTLVTKNISDVKKENDLSLEASLNSIIESSKPERIKSQEIFPLISIIKSKVARIGNRQIEIINYKSNFERISKKDERSKSIPTSDGKKKTHWAAILGFILAFTVVLSLIGLMLSIIGIVTVKEEPTKYRGANLAKVGLAISIFGTIIFLLILLILGLNSFLDWIR